MHSLTSELLHSALRLQERLENLFATRVDKLEEKLEAEAEVTTADYRILRQLAQLCGSQTRLCAQLSRQVDRQTHAEERELAREQAREAHEQEKAARRSAAVTPPAALPPAHPLPSMPQPSATGAPAPRVGAAPQPAHAMRR